MWRVWLFIAIVITVASVLWANIIITDDEQRGGDNSDDE